MLGLPEIVALIADLIPVALNVIVLVSSPETILVRVEVLFKKHELKTAVADVAKVIQLAAPVTLKTVSVKDDVAELVPVKPQLKMQLLQTILAPRT